MKIIKNFLFILLLVTLAQQTFAQAPSISYSTSISKLLLGSSYSFSPANSGGAVPATHYGQVAIFAGSPTEDVGYTNATGTAAQFSYPEQMTMDASGNLYVADAANNAIREVTPAGVVSTFAGDLTGVNGYSNGTGTSALFDYPDGLAIDASGNLYVSDYNNNAIRKITPSAVVSTFYDAGGSTFGPGGLCFDNAGNLIVAAQDASQIISINTSGIASVIAGNSPGYYNATGTAAQFNTPTDVRVDATGNIYVVDFENNAIRKISTSGVVTTFAGSSVNGNSPGYANGIGTAALFNNPTGLVIGPGGTIYVADLYNNDIRRITPDGKVTLLAGSSGQVPGDSDGLGTAAGFNLPDYMYVDGTGTGYIAEFAAERIRKITLTGYTLQGTLPAGLSFDSTTGIISGTPTSIATTGADTITAWNGSGYSSTIIKFGILTPPPIISYDVSTNTLTSGVPYSLSPSNSGGTIPAVDYAQTATFAGSTSASSGYTNGTGTAARFNQLTSSVMDAAGNLYVADGGNNSIRKITPSGIVSTFAGSISGASGSADGTGTAATFFNPQGLAIDASGNLIVSDYGNNSIRVIDPYGVVTTFYHSTSTFGPAGLTVDNSGNIIVAAKNLNQIIKLTPAAVVSTIAGSTAGYNNATGTSAQFNSPTDVKIDAASNLFVTDYINNAIREISPAGVVTTFAGSSVSGNNGGYLDGMGTAAEFNNPAGLFIAPGGVIYVADLSNNDIRMILPDGTVSLAAGSTSQTPGNADGTGSSASFNQPGSIYIDNSATAYITELAGNSVRMVALTGFALSGTLPSGITLDPGNGTFSGTFSGTVAALDLTVTAFNAGGFSVVKPLFGSANNDWTGSVSSVWGVGGNWSKTTVPGTTDIARIGVAVSYTNQPNLTASTSIGSVAFGPMAPGTSPVLTINSSVTLTTKTGFTIANSTAAIINGPGGLTISGNSPINSSTQSLTAATELIITLNSGTSYIAVTNSGNFKLASDQNGSASIAAIPNGSGVTGAVEVDRYITGGPGYRGYRFLTSPVHDATQVNGNNVYSLNYLKLGTKINGTTGTSGGFDATNNPIIYLFRESHTVCNSSFTCGYFRGVNDINVRNPVTYGFDGEALNYSLPVGNGLICYFTGDRSTASGSTSPNFSLMPATGILNQGTVSFVNWYNALTYSNPANLSYTTGVGPTIGENLVGNPYACSIDLNTYSTLLSTSGIYAPNTSTMVIENTAIGQSYGNWDTFNQVGTNGAGRYIQSGAAFYVTANNSSATLTFQETAKAASAQVPGNTGIGTAMSVLPGEPSGKQYLRLEMNADTIHHEDILIWFNSANKLSFEPMQDGIYMPGFNTISLSSLSSDGAQLGINKQPLPGNERRIIGLNVDAINNGTYHFNLREVIGLPQLYDIWLLDAYRKDSVDLRTAASYDFNIDKSDGASYGNKRFSLLIKQNPAYVYHLLDFTASKVPQTMRQVQIVWKTQNEQNNTGFTIERSTDNGNNFSALSTVGSASLGTYSFIDNSPVIGKNLYRLKQTDINNVITYSKTVMIGYSSVNDQVNGAKLNIFPNPASDGISLTIVPVTTDAVVYNISISSLSGTVVQQFTLSQLTWQGNVGNLQPGVYYVRVLNNKTKSLVVEGKFVKL